jgi:hypothetical protein
VFILSVRTGNAAVTFFFLLACWLAHRIHLLVSAWEEAIMDNPFAAAPSPPNMSSRFRPRYCISALCVADNGQSWEILVVNVSLDGCRLVWLSEHDRPALSRLQLLNQKGAVVEVGAQAFCTERRANIWVVVCRFGRPLTVKEMAEML